MQVVDKLSEFRSIISFGLIFVIAFIWMETQYVNASEFNQYQENDLVAQIEYLRDKQLRLKQEDKYLTFEDQRQLERLEAQLDRLKK